MMRMSWVARTGCSSPRTRAAIRSWQSSQGARETGYLDGASVAALRPSVAGQPTFRPREQAGAVAASVPASATPSAVSPAQQQPSSGGQRGVGGSVLAVDREQHEPCLFFSQPGAQRVAKGSQGGGKGSDTMMLRGFARSGVAAFGVLAVAALADGCRSSNHRPLVGAEPVALATNDASPFAVGVTPTMAPPVVVVVERDRLRPSLLITADGGVTMLVENLPLAAGAQVDYPRPGQGVQIRASPPVGIDRLVLLVTRQPFVGFTNNQGSTLTRPVALASTAEAFLREFNQTTDSLPASVLSSF